ncbi:MAG: IS3 family transposase [Rhodovulum sp.]
MNGSWVPHDTRDQIVDYIRHWSRQTQLPIRQLLKWMDVGAGKFYQWQQRYGLPNQHNAAQPRDGWLQPWEKQAILDFHDRHPLEGYRNLAFMMLDRNVVAVSPASVYRVLKAAGRLDRRTTRPSSKGQGFTQPLGPHQHWHIDIAYVNLAGTFYYLCTVLDGYSRFIVHWEIRPQMLERDVQTILQRAHERYPLATPRIISDNGPQFIARDFKLFVRQCGMTHVRISAYYPQSNGKLERWHGSVKRECIRPAAPKDVEDARRRVGEYVNHYNTVRLHGALGYITPADKLAGREQQVWAERDRRLEAARARRRNQGQAA